jgi:hypothetical protein
LTLCSGKKVRRKFIIAIVAVLITWLGFQQPIKAMERSPINGIPSQEEPQPQNEQSQAKQTNTEQSTTPKPKPSAQPSDQKPPTQEPNDKEQSVRIISAPPITIHRDSLPITIYVPRDWPTLIVSIILTSIGLVGTLIALNTLKKIREQTNIAKDAVDAAKTASDTANAMAAKMKDAAERELRAYVGPSAATIKCVEKTKYFAAVEIKNFGRTPAYKLRNFTDSYIGPFLSEASQFKEPSESTIYAKGTLFPGSPFYGSKDVETASLNEGHICRAPL